MCQSESSDFTVAVSIKKAAVKAWSSVVFVRPRRTLLKGTLCVAQRPALRILFVTVSAPPLGRDRHASIVLDLSEQLVNPLHTIARR